MTGLFKAELFAKVKQKQKQPKPKQQQKQHKTNKMENYHTAHQKSTISLPWNVTE